MDELQQLQQAILSGTATQDQMERFLDLTNSKGEELFSGIYAKVNDKTATDKEIAIFKAKNEVTKNYTGKYKYNPGIVPQDQFDFPWVVTGEKGENFKDLTDKTMMSPIDSPYANPGAETDQNSFQNANSFLPYLFPGGSDLTSELYTLGRAIGAGKGQQGRALTGIAAGGAAALDIARNLASGIAFEKMNQQVDDIYQTKRKQPLNFSPEEQTRNTNNTGGINFELGGMFKDENGGEPTYPYPVESYPQDNMFQVPFDHEYVPRVLNRDIMDMYHNLYSTPQEQPSESEQKLWYRRWLNDMKNGQSGDTRVAKLGGMFFGEEGGEMELGNGQHNMQEEGQENIQQQSQEQPQDQQQMMEQLISIVSQMLQQGKDPNQIVQSLVQQGIPQQQAIAIVQMVQQQQAQLKTKNGEMLNAQPGDTISFKHGGKKVTGKVKEIRDGKIILE